MRMKKLTLDINERQEQEDYQGEPLYTSVLPRLHWCYHSDLCPTQNASHMTIHAGAAIDMYR